MEFISAEDFLKQDKEVQKVFLDWFENEACSYDIVVFKNDLQYVTFYGDIEYQESFNYEDSYIPLLTEGQLRKFIEDKTAMGTVNVDYFEGYRIKINSSINQSKYYKDLGNDLLYAYWKVSVEIAKESLSKNNKINSCNN